MNINSDNKHDKFLLNNCKNRTNRMNERIGKKLNAHVSFHNPILSSKYLKDKLYKPGAGGDVLKDVVDFPFPFSSTLFSSNLQYKYKMYLYTNIKTVLKSVVSMLFITSTDGET